MDDNSSKNSKDGLVPTVIDFSKMSEAEGQLKESYILTFGLALRWLMPALFRGASMPVSIRGNQTQIRDFANVMSRERNYLQSWKTNGLDNPQTYRNKARLKSAIAKFERSTGLKWPFDQ